MPTWAIWLIGVAAGLFFLRANLPVFWHPINASTRIWNGYKLRRLVLVAVAVGIFGFVFPALLGLVDKTSSPALTMLGAMAGCGMALAVVGLWVIDWPCPRCGKPYDNLGFNGFGAIHFFFYPGPCRHCGLRFGAAVDTLHKVGSDAEIAE